MAAEADHEDAALAAWAAAAADVDDEDADGEDGSDVDVGGDVAGGRAGVGADESDGDDDEVDAAVAVAFGVVRRRPVACGDLWPFAWAPAMSDGAVVVVVGAADGKHSSGCGCDLTGGCCCLLLLLNAASHCCCYCCHHRMGSRQPQWIACQPPPKPRWLASSCHELSFRPRATNFHHRGQRQDQQPAHLSSRRLLRPPQPPLCAPSSYTF